MTTEKPYILLIVFSTMLFLTFSMMHEFDWLIPANPATIVSSGSSIPAPDIVEEPGSEDEIEHELGYTVISYSDKKFLVNPFLDLRLFTPQVLTPPPDLA
jgi:hypothetical protein